MANYCANSIAGNDANSGAYNPAVPDDWSTAKRTIGAMYTAMSAGDTGYLTGYFNEALTDSKGITLQGVGLALVDGTGLAVNPLIYNSNAYGLTLNDLVLWNPGLTCVGCSNAHYKWNTLRRCQLRNCDTGISNAYNVISTIHLEDCLVVATTNAAVVYGYSTSSTMTILRSSIVAGNTAVYRGSTSAAPSIHDSFLSAPTLITSEPVPLSNYNCLDFSGANKTTIGGVNYDTLALHQAGTGLDLNSLDSTPAAECADTTRSLYGLRPTSQLLRRGSAGRGIGWGGAMLAVSPGINADVYDHPYVVSGALVKDDSGYWVRDGVSTAVARFGDPTGLLLADLGAARNVGQVLLEGTETFHTSQFDQSAGAGPYLTERYKLSATQDALSDGTGWTVLKRHGRIDVATYRYFGLEVTWMGP